MATKKLQILGSLGNKIYTQNEEPTDAPEGALWLDLDEDSQAASGIQSDWNQTDPTADDYIKNKPSITNGIDGKDGQDGVGIQSIEQTVISDQDGGDNVLTVTLTDGQTTDFTVKNGSKGSGSDAQSDWNQTDENADDYIKNKPFYYGEMYVEDFVLPTPTELYSTVSSASNADLGYALLGYKAIFEAGKTYTLLETITDGENSSSKNIELTAYPLTALGFPSAFADAVALLDSSNNIYIASGATATDLKNFSDIALAEDTMYLTYKIEDPDISYTLTCKEYNNTIWQYNTIDVNYLPMEQIGENIKLPNDAVKTAALADDTVTTNKLVDGSVTSNKIANNAIGNDLLQDGAVTTEKLADGSVTYLKLKPIDLIVTRKVDVPVGWTEEVFSPNAYTKVVVDASYTVDFADIPSEVSQGWLSLDCGQNIRTYVDLSQQGSSSHIDFHIHMVCEHIRPSNGTKPVGIMQYTVTDASGNIIKDCFKVYQDVTAVSSFSMAVLAPNNTTYIPFYGRYTIYGMALERNTYNMAESQEV